MVQATRSRCPILFSRLPPALEAASKAAQSVTAETAFRLRPAAPRTPRPHHAQPPQPPPPNAADSDRHRLRPVLRRASLPRPRPPCSAALTSSAFHGAPVAARSCGRSDGRASEGGGRGRCAVGVGGERSRVRESADGVRRMQCGEAAHGRGDGLRARRHDRAPPLRIRRAPFARRAAPVAFGDVVSGYRLARTDYISVASSLARLWTYEKTGAEDIAVSNGEDEKCMSVILRSWPDDSRGTPHARPRPHCHLLESQVPCQGAVR